MLREHEESSSLNNLWVIQGRLTKMPVRMPQPCMHMPQGESSVGLFCQAETTRAEASRASDRQLEAVTEQIKKLERDLADAHAKFERAQAMAEKTRSGYVYIVSNIGSFGEDVVKIGLTRRLDPADRIRELGDASVPFIFDTHAIIYSDDAPALERALHNDFDKARVNASNYRKEFFRVSISDVEAAVKRLAPGAAFFRDIEAQEYQETLARRQAALAAVGTGGLTLLPETI
jgi:hypothetical protein